MKRQLVFLFLIMCLALCGCEGKAEIRTPESFEVPDVTAVPTEAPMPETTEETTFISAEETIQPPIAEIPTIEDYLDSLHLFESSAQEYGEAAGYIELEEDMVVRILYPECDIENLNSAIEAWVNETVEYYRAESVGVSENGWSAELTAEYESCVVNNEIVSVKITGFYDRPYLAHPIDVVATFHADMNTGVLITLEDVLHSSGAAALKERVAVDADIPSDQVKDNLLDFWTLKKEGLEIILPRGEHLSMADGAIALLYTYDEIASICLLYDDTSITEATAEQTTLETVSSEPTTPMADPTRPMVALTFDDGPSKHTARLLDIFKENGGSGTFFLVGNLIDSRNDVVLRTVAEGHEIAGHGWNHHRLTSLTEEEMTDQLMATRAKIYEVTGIDTTMVRPPYGSYDDQLKSVSQNLGMYMVNWSVDTLDWKNRDPDVIYDTIMAEVKDGAIILCHDLHGTTVDAMERVIPDLISKGYQLVTVSELFAHSERTIAAGKVYIAR